VTQGVTARRQGALWPAANLQLGILLLFLFPQFFLNFVGLIAQPVQLLRVNLMHLKKVLHMCRQQEFY
jgi:hypothetical protein